MLSQDLTEYELQRNARIARNREILLSTGALQTAENLRSLAQNRQQRRKKPKEINLQPTRRSSRPKKGLHASLAEASVSAVPAERSCPAFLPVARFSSLSTMPTQRKIDFSDSELTLITPDQVKIAVYWCRNFVKNQVPEDVSKKLSLDLAKNDIDAQLVKDTAAEKIAEIRTELFSGLDLSVGNRLRVEKVFELVASGRIVNWLLFRSFVSRNLFNTVHERVKRSLTVVTRHSCRQGKPQKVASLKTPKTLQTAPSGNTRKCGRAGAKRTIHISTLRQSTPG